MPATKRILIVRHPGDAYEHTHYVIRVFADEWRRQGMSVEVTARLDRPPPPDVLVIPHLDLTRTPANYQDFLARCRVVVNRGVTDISKRCVSQAVIDAPGGYDGPVMVKTDRNSGGIAERSKLGRRGRLPTVALAAARRLPWTLTGILDPTAYPIYAHPRLVPRLVWHNPLLVVEKFLPERHGELYCVRQYHFFGSRELNTLALSPKPIVKARDVVRREVLPETPPELRRLRAALRFDFGKFDYVLHDGRPVLFDANRTPTYNPASAAGSPSKLLLDLAAGIDEFTRGM